MNHGAAGDVETAVGRVGVTIRTVPLNAHAEGDVAKPRTGCRAQ